MSFDAFSMPAWAGKGDNTAGDSAGRGSNSRHGTEGDGFNSPAHASLDDIFSLGAREENTAASSSGDGSDEESNTYTQAVSSSLLDDAEDFVRSHLPKLEDEDSSGDALNDPPSPKVAQANIKNKGNQTPSSGASVNNVQEEPKQKIRQKVAMPPSPAPSPESNRSVQGLARAGKAYVLHDDAGNLHPNISWDKEIEGVSDYVPPEDIDYADLRQVNMDLTGAKSRSFAVSHYLKQAQRDLVEAKTKYKRALRRELLQISGGTAEVRKAAAEIRCEEEELAVDIAEQLVEEWKKRATDCRDDLKALENISHNVRAQMNVFEK